MTCQEDLPDPWLVPELQLVDDDAASLPVPQLVNAFGSRASLLFSSCSLLDLL